MPGRFVSIMQAERQSGGYPPKALTWMLFRNALVHNELHNDWALNRELYTHAAMMASCHPNAIQFMNIVTNVGWPDDFHPVVMRTGQAAVDMIQTAADAVQQNNNAIWVKYGAHSFTLLTGYDALVESVEAYAGGAGGYWFHESVLDEPDHVGGDRNHGLPTRLQARNALLGLVDPGGPHYSPANPRTQAADRLSRGGYGGFDEEGGVPELHVEIAQMVTRDVFRRRVRTRLQEVGWCVARAEERANPNVRVCCRCQGTIQRANLQGSRWRVCNTHTCQRAYCRACKHLLTTTNPWALFFTLHIASRERACDAGHPTTRQ